MSKILITIHNAETGEITQRPATSDELAQMEIDKANETQRQAEIAAKAQARQALLNKLGITEEEAQLLLGGN